MPTNMEELKKLMAEFRKARRRIEEKKKEIEAAAKEGKPIEPGLKGLIEENRTLIEKVTEFLKALKEASEIEEKESREIRKMLTQITGLQAEISKKLGEVIEGLQKVRAPEIPGVDIKKDLDFIKEEIRYYSQNYLGNGLRELANAIGRIEGKVERYMTEQVELLKKLVEKSPKEELLTLNTRLVGLESKLSKVESALEELKGKRIKIEKVEVELEPILKRMEELKSELAKIPKVKTEELESAIEGVRDQIRGLEAKIGELGEIREKVSALEGLIKAMKKDVFDELYQRAVELKERAKLGQDVRKQVEELKMALMEQKPFKVLRLIEELEKVKRPKIKIAFPSIPKPSFPKPKIKIRKAEKKHNPLETYLLGLEIGRVAYVDEICDALGIGQDEFKKLYDALEPEIKEKFALRNFGFEYELQGKRAFVERVK